MNHYNFPVNIHSVNRVWKESLKTVGVDVIIRCLLCSPKTLRRSGPVCRGCYRVPFGGINSFEVNRTIVNLLESLSHPESKPMLQAKCAICKLDDTITVKSSIRSFFKSNYYRYVNIVEKQSVVNVVENITENSVNIFHRN